MQRVTAVMMGGSAATYYAPEAYQSKDIDFIITMHSPGGQDALAALGYRPSGDYYLHAESPFPLEFPAGPLMVGDERIERWDTSRRRDEVLHVLTPTDSCRDRLAAFMFWNDFSALDQALAVYGARRDDTDLKLIGRWCRRAGHADKYDLFLMRAGKARKQR